MRRFNRITYLALPALALLAACESNTAPDLGGPEGTLSAEALQEVSPSLDDQLTGALLEDVRFSLETEGAPQAVLVAQAEQAFAAAAAAYDAGNTDVAVAKADEARMALGTAYVDGLGDVGLDELFERIYHLREWLEGDNDCVADVDRVLRALDRLLEQAKKAVENGNKRRAAALLILAGQIVDRACVERDVDRDNFNRVARFAVARANASVDLAKRLLPDAPTDTQVRLLHRAVHLTEWAEKAYQNHHFRRAFALARRAEIMALRTVIDTDGVQDEEIRLVYEVAETLLEEAAAIEDPTEVQQRLVNIADKLFQRGVEKLEAGNVRGIACLWRSAVTSMLAL